MNKKHLLWIIPICLIVSFIGGIITTSAGFGVLMQDYPIIGCIYNMDDSLNVDGNKMPFTKDSQRDAIQWRCAKEYVDFNITDYEEIFEFT